MVLAGETANLSSQWWFFGPPLCRWWLILETRQAYLTGPSARLDCSAGLVVQCSFEVVVCNTMV